jgi:ubiquinone/menaquinone biosynthesis C-methylase UbiE
MAFLFRRGNKLYENVVQQRKRALLGALGGTVLEVGPGAGANLQYLRKDIRWIGVEPNPAMVVNLKKTAHAQGRAIELVGTDASHIELPDRSVDHVVCTLVLCSVPDVARALDEIHRVLKPGGTLVFVEHVAAPRGTWFRRLQEFVRPLWMRIYDHCDPARETAELIRKSKFKDVAVDDFRTGFAIVSPHVIGRAVRAEAAPAS